MWIFISVFIISLFLLYWLFKQPVDIVLLTSAIAQLNKPITNTNVLLKNKLLSIVKKVEQQKISDLHYSLTINYVKIIDDKKINFLEFKKILENHTIIKSYNLTFSNRVNFMSHSKLNEFMLSKQYTKYYNKFDFIFCGEELNEIYFDFLSPHLTNNIKVSNINNLFKVYHIHCKTSKVVI